VLVIGGGVNGTGIARDAAGRGMRVVLCEKDDLASHTSSNSSKLIHGGLRYLETFQFQLVRKALLEREILLRSAPHIIEPLRFVLPHHQSLRPAWMLSAGLFLYDHLAPRALLPDSERIALAQHETGDPLKEHYSTAFLYSDARVDDARLVILNALDAAQRSATILNYTECISVSQQNGLWHAQLQNSKKEIITLRAKCLVNATGSWAANFYQDFLTKPVLVDADQPDFSISDEALKLKLIKGSHIVVRKLFSHAYAYIFKMPMVVLCLRFHIRMTIP